MKARTLILMAAAATLVLACKETKTTEEKLAEFNEWNETFAQNYRTRLISLKDDAEAAKAFADSAYDAYLEYNKAALKKNLDNAVGVEALKEVYSDLEPEELSKVLEKLTAPLEGRDSAFVANLKENVKASLATVVGKPYTDFSVQHVIGTDKEGNPVYETRSLSDYVGKGKVFLVDFWSPWCPPCKAELPNIKSVWEKYHGDDFDVLSVAVWEESRGMNWKNTIDTAAVYGIQWHQINNGHQEPAALYGIQGIPHMVLFGADGTIIARGDALRGEKLDPAVAAALGK
ncbi:MAG: redoxin domain-containing protein [Bacteroidales bacterium]|nr:redoxin domain-containing protein [Bacteroidales bacterium]MBQ2173322.1 redoxin domain-containing protein [Bacteroidales bacterium]